MVLLGSLTPLAAPDSAAAQQQSVQVVGRVTDEASNQPVADATVTLSGRTDVTDERGFFLFDSVAPGRYSVRIQHLAYGEFTDDVRVGFQDMRLRVRMSETAIELEPVIVDVETRDQREARVSGSRRNVVTREEIEQSLGTAETVGSVLARNVPGVRVRTPPGRAGSLVCIEFRSGRSLDNPNRCHLPVVMMDGVRVSFPQALFMTLQLEDVQRMEVIPPGEAGVRYGTDSQYGVLLISTRTGADVLGREADTRLTRRRGGYDWSEEPEPYPWAKVFGTAFLTNAAGMAIGVAVARDCLSFDGLANHFLSSDCGTLGTAGSRLALITLPMAAVTFGTQKTGGSDLSKGRILQTAVGAMLVGVPGYIMATGGEVDAFSGADWVGGAFLLVGIPAVATLADRLFRDLRH